MANHTITLTAGEENLYQKYLLIFNLTETTVMATAKTSLASQVLQSINDAGHQKFKGLSVADKIAFLG